MATKIGPDSFNVGDAIDDILREISNTVSWTKRKRELFTQLNQCLEAEKYIIFHSDFRTYGLQTKGSSAIYSVPDDQRGTLKEYAGKKARIICLDYSDRWPGYSGRKFAAKAIS